jgi:hypothetical protein
MLNLIVNNNPIVIMSNNYLIANKKINSFTKVKETQQYYYQKEPYFNNKLRI